MIDIINQHGIYDISSAMEYYNREETMYHVRQMIVLERIDVLSTIFIKKNESLNYSITLDMIYSYMRAEYKTDEKTNRLFGTFVNNLGIYYLKILNTKDLDHNATVTDMILNLIKTEKAIEDGMNKVIEDFYFHLILSLIFKNTVFSKLIISKLLGKVNNVTDLKSVTNRIIERLNADDFLLAEFIKIILEFAIQSRFEKKIIGLLIECFNERMVEILHQYCGDYIDFFIKSEPVIFITLNILKSKFVLMNDENSPLGVYVHERAPLRPFEKMIVEYFSRYTIDKYNEVFKISNIRLIEYYSKYETHKKGIATSYVAELNKILMDENFVEKLKYKLIDNFKIDNDLHKYYNILLFSDFVTEYKNMSLLGNHSTCEIYPLLLMLRTSTLFTSYKPMSDLYIYIVNDSLMYDEYELNLLFSNSIFILMLFNYKKKASLADLNEMFITPEYNLLLPSYK